MGRLEVFRLRSFLWRKDEEEGRVGIEVLYCDGHEFDRYGEDAGASGAGTP
jgi:hypothetical protein